MTHKEVWYAIDGEETTSEDTCPEEEYWDEGLEGFVCTKCHYNTTIK